METDREIDDAYKRLNEHALLLYDFVIRYYNYIYTNHSYGSGMTFTMMEIHTLTYIEEHPGVTITELAKMWCKTKSAVSQSVKKLVDMELVERRFAENNSKSVLLYTTEKGGRISHIHKAYDVADITQTQNQLILRCGEADLEAFYRVLREYLGLLQEN